MKRPTFTQGVWVAAGLALLGSIGLTALSSLAFAPGLHQGLIAALALIYLLYLLASSGERIGRVTTVSLWTLLSLGLWLIGVPTTLYLLMQIALLWLVRSIYFYSSTLAAILDLGLNLVAMATAYWAALHTGSTFLSLWCFFLAQALFVAIPPALNPSGNASMDPAGELENFERARRNAEKAIQQLFTE